MNSAYRAVLPVVILSGVAIGFAGGLMVLGERPFGLAAFMTPAMRVKVIANADNSVEVAVNGRPVLTAAGETPATAEISVRRGDTIRLEGRDSGGNKGVCVLLVDSAGRLVFGTTPAFLSQWSEIDPNAGTRIGPARPGDNQAWPDAVAKVAGHACQSYWGRMSEAHIALVATIP